MFKTKEESIAAYREIYIDLTAEKVFMERRPLGGLRESSPSAEGRMRTMRELHVAQDLASKILGMTEAERDQIEKTCEDEIEKKVQNMITRFNEHQHPKELFT